jgi:hypothetical protein
MSWGIRTTIQDARLMEPEMPLRDVHMSSAAVVCILVDYGIQFSDDFCAATSSIQILTAWMSDTPQIRRRFGVPQSDDRPGGKIFEQLSS